MSKIKIRQFAVENNYEYQIIDDDGNIFLQGDGFKSEQEAKKWLSDLRLLLNNSSFDLENNDKS